MDASTSRLDKLEQAIKELQSDIMKPKKDRPPKAQS